MHRIFVSLAIAALLPALPAAAAAKGDLGMRATPLPAPDPSYANLTYQKDYRIGPLDKLDISVFMVDEMKSSVQVDASGNISLPLIGGLAAAGKTTQQLSAEIASKLEAKYLRSPQVTVLVSEAESQKVTVGGAVGQPGVYEIKGHTTLLQAVALARGADRVADLKHVTVFRTVNGQKMAATVDLGPVQKGQAEDPEVYGDDVIMVGTSGFKAGLRDMAGASSLMNFIPLLRGW